MQTPKAQYNSAYNIPLTDLPGLLQDPSTRRQIERLMRHSGRAANKGLQRLRTH